jgi:hypothetical protein
MKVPKSVKPLYHTGVESAEVGRAGEGGVGYGLRRAGGSGGIIYRLEGGEEGIHLCITRV